MNILTFVLKIEDLRNLKRFCACAVRLTAVLTLEHKGFRESSGKSTVQNSVTDRVQGTR